MYKIKANGVEHYSETLVYVKKAANGCFAPCQSEYAEYVVGKVQTEDGVADTVFENAEIEYMDGCLVLTDMKEALSILGVN